MIGYVNGHYFDCCFSMKPSTVKKNLPYAISAIWGTLSLSEIERCSIQNGKSGSKKKLIYRWFIFFSSENRRARTGKLQIDERKYEGKRKTCVIRRTGIMHIYDI